MRNPNGYGTVVRLSGNRRRPYIVKKVKGWKENGQPLFDIIGYAETREEGNILLANYNNDPWDVDMAKITLEELISLFKDKKYPRIGKSNQRALNAAAKHVSSLYNIPYKQIKAYQMQDTINECGRGPSTQGHIMSLWKHLDDLALEMDITSKRYSSLLARDPSPESNRDRISDEVINRIWAHQNYPWVDTILILIYSGWRVSELVYMEKNKVDLQLGTMQGGIKTQAGKDRIVPIHSLIYPMVQRRMAENGKYLIQRNGRPIRPNSYRDTIWRPIANHLGIPGTPHWCRHTFESLLDSAGANRKCIDLMLGHKSKDTGNRIYNHKAVSELKANIELITR